MKIKFLPQNITVDVNSGKSVMELAKENKLPVSSSCNGMCSCAECRVYVKEGEEYVLPPSAKEVELIGEGHFIDNRRLSCQLFCFGDVTIDLSEQVERDQMGGAKKQFLKQFSKTGKESSSVGGILVEQDKEIDTVQVYEETESASYFLAEEGHQKQKKNKSHSLKKGKKSFQKKRGGRQDSNRGKKHKGKKRKSRSRKRY